MEKNKYEKIYDSNGEKKIQTQHGNLFIEFGIYEQKKDGKLMWMEHEEQVHLTPMKDNQGKPIDITCISDDYIANMLIEMYKFKIKKDVDRNEIKQRNKELIDSIIKELKGN